MRFGIISDIHSNSEALDCVLNNMEKIDNFICLGDIVGYGADPNYCIKKIKDLNCRCVAGNHDFGAIGKVDINYFNDVATKAIQWTSQKIEENNKKFLLSLNEKIQIIENIFAVHGSPREPIFEYILYKSSAYDIFTKYDFEIYFIGHSHLAGYFSFNKRNNQVSYTGFINGGCVEISKNQRYIINCGSVGQPRDGNPDASYGVYDTEDKIVKIYRIPYPIYLTQKKIINAGLPEILADRLSWGR